MKHASRWTGVAPVAFLACGLAQAQTTERVSVDSTGAQSNADSQGYASISTDGHFVAFTSSASNLVPGDTNGVRDIFVRDRVNGTTERVSVSSTGAEANGSSSTAAISADGRFVAFVSDASNLVPGVAGGQVFLRDRLNGTTELVTVSFYGGGSSGGGDAPSISADGRFVAFDSVAVDLLSYYDSDFYSDVYVRDRLLGITSQVSPWDYGPEAYGDSYRPSISADGRFVAFDSDGTDLLWPGTDTNGVRDIFLHDSQSPYYMERVNVSTTWAQANAESRGPSISADGKFIAFYSDASNLVAGVSSSQIYVRDRIHWTTELVSSDSAGVPSAAVVGLWSSISADGRFVAFQCADPNLAPGDTNGTWDIYVKDRQSGLTERVSVATGWAGADDQSLLVGSVSSLSGDGRCTTYLSRATNLVPGDTNGFLDIFVRDRGVPATAFCLGDGSAGACPCANSGASGKGCENSASTGGAVLASAGSASVSGDSLLLTTSGEPPTASSVVLQGDGAIGPIPFGDGLRCTGGALKRMYTKTASAGVVSAPQPGDASFSARSALLGDLIASGSTRYYQTYYRDPVSSFCASPTGNIWNVSSGLSILWGP